MSKAMIGRILFCLAALACLSPWVSSSVGLLMGIALSLTLGNSYSSQSKLWIPRLLQVGIIALGAGMNLAVVVQAGVSGALYTLVGILFTFAVGTLLGRWLRNDRDTSLLLNSGTAICGGSAIAAVAAVTGAAGPAVSVALASVFCLNALALLVFPPLGHFLGLTEGQFGVWSALAIHDTSSVVGAALQYGSRALSVATTTKLARALWIVPMAWVIGYVWARNGQQSGAKAKRPWFILGFVLMAACATWIPALQEHGHWIALLGRRILVLTLFLIGAGLSRTTLRQVGARPFVHGVLLWVIVSGVSLLLIMKGWIASP